MTRDLKHIIETTLVPHTAFQEAVNRLDQCFQYADGCLEPICLAIVGESRTGKSRALEEFRNGHGPVRTEEGMTVPILSVTTPSKPTVKGLAELMLKNMGEKVDTSGTEIKKTGQLKTLLKNAGTRMIVIDEFQHFYDKGTHTVMHHAADWLKELVDNSHVALVVSGLPSCRAVIDKNEQLAGRFLSAVEMPRFDWVKQSDREEFIGILGAFDQSLSEHFNLPALSTEAMAFRCFYATGGLIGYLTKLLREAVWNALADNRTAITMEHLADAKKNAIWTIDGLPELINPFSKQFSAQPTADLLSDVLTIGARAEPPQPKARGRMRSAPVPNMLSVLSAS